MSMSMSMSMIMSVSPNRYTIKGGYRRAEKKLLSADDELMMKAAKLGWARLGADHEQTRIRPGAMQEQGMSKSREGALSVHLPNFIQITERDEL